MLLKVGTRVFSNFRHPHQSNTVELRQGTIIKVTQDAFCEYGIQWDSHTYLSSYPKLMLDDGFIQVIKL